MTNWKEILCKLKADKDSSLEGYNLSTDEEKLIEEIIRTNTLNESLELLVEINIDEEWNDQKLSFLSKEENLPQKRGHFKRNLLRYAAGILFPFFIFSAYYIDSRSYFSKPLANYKFSTVNDSKGVLILADGSKKKLERLDSTLISKLFERRDEDLEGYPSIGNKSVDIAYNTLIIPAGATYRIQLADGTRVHLNENTIFKFPANFPIMSERKVILEKGEVFFNVTTDSERNFVVAVGSADISVLGTAFNVQLTPEYLSTTLIEGKVKLSNAENAVLLIPNQQAIINGQNTEIIVKNVDVTSTLAWHNKLWVFEQQTLESVMTDLTSWYKFDYEFVDEEAKDLTYTASLEKSDTIENVLRLLEKTEKVFFTIKRNKIFIHKVNNRKFL